MTDFDVVPSGMEGVADRLAGLPGQISSAISDLMGKVNQYADLNNGSAIQAYQAAQLEWNQGLELVNDGVGKSAPILRSIADEFMQGDLRAAQQYPTA
ncbi:WXG100 family type VII secretion target [Micromonospora arborensis]|uniref:WXG100 family type VII secretion target n=1 Tax=Micromonospora arborensis TaxID=2116518 RepID=UPI00371F1863